MRAGIAAIELPWAGGAGAEDIAIDPDAWPYSAIGKLDVVLGTERLQARTATLLGPRPALTAAHCLRGGPRKRWVNPGAVHVVAALYRKPGADGTAASDRQGDRALVELADPIPGPPPTLEAPAPPAVRREIRRAGDSRLKPQVMTAQGHCTAQPTADPSPRLLHDCRALPGELRSALLRAQGRNPAPVAPNPSR